MDPYRDDDRLIGELRSLRPAPRPAFAAELDERAAAGFPRRPPLARSPLAQLVERLRAFSLGRLLTATGAAALVTVAIATAVVAVNDSAPRGLSPDRSRTGRGSIARPGVETEQPQAETAGAAAAPSSPAKPSSGEGETTAKAAVPQPAYEDESPVTTGGRTGPLASGVFHRDVERSADLVLAADPREVADDSAKVFDTVRSYDGIVLSSSTSEGAAGEAGARFDLLVPSAKLSDALAALSGIAAVRSRHEATVDITAPTVRLGERLQDSRARIDSLLAQLAAAETEAEREAVEAELRGERRHAARLRSWLARLHRRANFSRVFLRIETGSGANGSGGGWGLGNALHDAGHILAIAAGVTLVGLAILGPVALIALLAWLAHRTWTRRARERTLG